MEFALRHRFSQLGFITFFCLTATLFASAACLAETKGKFKPFYEEPKNPEYAEAQKTFRKEKLLESITQQWNASIIIPQDICVGFVELGQPNAVYVPETHRILFGYELFENLDERFQDVEADDDVRMEHIVGAMMFILHHELGHALVDVLSLPVTGKEEDAVDQLACLIMLNGGEDGEKAAASSGEFFRLLQDDDEDDSEKAWWDEHSLGKQRYYNILSWIYGSDPEKYANIVGEDGLPEERAARSVDEYTKMKAAWKKILAPHLIH
ncbi:MAG: DUF4344 domain-containing metallopeptidase [Planctomycetes bacterium]|nr:DUF4344 domain-containing metallopeptidase [Planctomycetota bacterium]